MTRTVVARAVLGCAVLLAVLSPAQAAEKKKPAKVDPKCPCAGTSSSTVGGGGPTGPIIDVDPDGNNLRFTVDTTPLGHAAEMALPTAFYSDVNSIRLANTSGHAMVAVNKFKVIWSATDYFRGEKKPDGTIHWYCKVGAAAETEITAVATGDTVPDCMWGTASSAPPVFSGIGGGGYSFSGDWLHIEMN